MCPVVAFATIPQNYVLEHVPFSERRSYNSIFDIHVSDWCRDTISGQKDTAEIAPCLYGGENSCAPHLNKNQCTESENPTY